MDVQRRIGTLTPLVKFLFGSICPYPRCPYRVDPARIASGNLGVGVGMPHRAVAIANEFLRLPGASETLTQMKLQKLVYIAHGWNLVINDQPLVSDPVAAWAYGPVYRDLYDHTKFFGKEPIGREINPDDDDPARFFLELGNTRQPPYRAHLTDREREVIRHVWKRYGSLSAFQLSQLTHERGTPWSIAYARGRDSEIPNENIKRHYLTLAERAQAN